MPSIIYSSSLRNQPFFFIFFKNTTDKGYCAFLNKKYKGNKRSWKVKCEMLNEKNTEALAI